MKFLLIILMVLSSGYSQEFGRWRWADDTAEFTMDKEAHFVGSAGAYFFFRHKDYTQKESILYSFYLGLTKECIDAILPWEKYGRWGGDGFSKYDLAYAIAGIGIAFLIDALILALDLPSFLPFSAIFLICCFCFFIIIF